MTEQLRIDGVEDVRERWAAWEACFTPPAVVDQGWRWLIAHHPVRVPKVLDPCAGAGVFGMVAKRLFTHVGIGLEPRVEEKEHVCRHYDLPIPFTVQEFATLNAGVTHPERFDFIVTNPPWGEGEATTNWGDIFDACWPMLAADGVLAFLGPSTWGHSDESSECARIFDEHVPAYQLRIRGRIAFNGGSGTDNRKCSWWVWCNDGVARDSTTMITLPALPAEARRWNVRPGTEET